MKSAIALLEVALESVTHHSSVHRSAGKDEQADDCDAHAADYKAAIALLKNMIPPNPGEGYRLLEPGEMIGKYDSVFMGDHWCPTSLHGSRVAEPKMPVPPAVYRRLMSVGGKPVTPP